MATGLEHGLLSLYQFLESFTLENAYLQRFLQFLDGLGFLLQGELEDFFGSFD